MHNPSISVSMQNSLELQDARCITNHATVALNHPLLQEPNKVLHAAETLRMLKSEDLVQWARYKGHAGNKPRLRALVVC